MLLDTWCERFLASRLDAAENTVKNYRSALKKVSASFGERDPATITAGEIAEWVAGLAATYKPGTVQLYLIAFRLLLDFVGLEDNPARDSRVELPKREREEPQPPTAAQLITTQGLGHARILRDDAVVDAATAFVCAR